MSARRNPVVSQYNDFRKPTKPCVWCGRQTTSPKGACESCRYVDLNFAKPVHENDGLPAGEWVLRRGVKVFHPGLRQPTEDELRREWAS